MPINKAFDQRTDADELVIFQDAQALPLFLVYFSNQRGIYRTSSKASFTSVSSASIVPSMHLRLPRQELKSGEVWEMRVISQEKDGSWKAEFVQKKD